MDPVLVLERVLAGDVRALDDLGVLAPEVLLSAKGRRRAVLDRAGVRRALLDFDAGLASAADLQAWASFVRRGWLPAWRYPSPSLDIDYELDREDEIVEIIGRLDEIGDLIDGDPPSHEEVAAMLATLDDEASARH